MTEAPTPDRPGSVPRQAGTVGAGEEEWPTISRIVPGPVRWAERFSDDAAVRLFDEEHAVVARAVDKRRREFATARACAREALGALGFPPVPLVPGSHGAPTWPSGIAGSMTHCTGYRAAAVARTGDVAALGIDAEPNRPLPSGVLSVIASPEEVSALRGLPGVGVAWDRLLFSAKESVYKAWYPIAQRWLEFQEAVVTLDPAGTFEARLLVSGESVLGRPLTGFSGRWTAGRRLLLTAVAVPVRDRDGSKAERLDDSGG